MKNYIVVDRVTHWKQFVGNTEIITSEDYILNEKYLTIARARICNLSSSYKYQSLGYYVSLLAEARGHRIFPSVRTIQDISSCALLKTVSSSIDGLIQKSLAKLKSNEFVLSIYFGKNLAAQYEKLSLELYNLFQAPLIRARFTYKKTWTLKSISPISAKDVPEEHLEFLKESAEAFFNKGLKYIRKKRETIYDLAILYDEKEKFAASNLGAIKKFIKAGNSIGLNVQIITKDDYNKIPFFDALFIRETTAVNNHTYRFARRASSEGLVTIDDPTSIIKCTNKVYLDELLTKSGIKRPRTLIINKKNIHLIEKELSFPCVLKLPDGSFSQNVQKVDTTEALETSLKDYFLQSELIIAQQFMPTEFDWRIGIIDHRPIFACQYFMVKNHWQIYRHQHENKSQDGKDHSIKIEDVPKSILTVALKAAKLIGDGFYGVDIKFVDNTAYLIEINDNPSVDSGVEDKILKNNLYLSIMQVFLDRIKMKKETI